MEAIQIQTPPKDEDLEMPELSVPPEDSEIDETVEEENEQDSIAVAETADEPQTTAEETRDDEIVVEDQEDSENEGNENGHEDHNSVLSSPPPESDAEANTSKTGRIHCINFTDCKEKRSKPTRPIGQKGVKLGDVEGIKARLDKRLGSDELLKVTLRLIPCD